MTDYRELIEKTIEREIGVLGRDRAIKVAQYTKGIKVKDDGTVDNYVGDGKEQLGRVIEAYADIASVARLIIKKELKPFFQENSDLEKPDVLK